MNIKSFEYLSDVKINIKMFRQGNTVSRLKLKGIDVGTTIMVDYEA